MRPLPRLSDTDLKGGDRSRKLRVCVVTSEIIGPTKNGGIGTATSGLVEHLAGDSHQVTVLYTQVWGDRPLCTEKSWDHWVKELRLKGVDLRYIPHAGSYADWRHKAWLVKDHLGQGEYDLVYFNEHHGSGYYTMAAKRAGLSPFSEQIHCVITHGSIEWVLNTNDQYIERVSDLEMIGLERRSVEWADFVIGPSEYLLKEYESYGWRLPAGTYCQPYPLFRAPAAFDGEARRIEELVFFGRLETRKGLWLFCETVERLGERLRGRTVTFMGRMTDMSGFASAALVVARSAKWPFRVRLLTRLGPAEALAYLRGPNRLAIMPSLADNSPCVVYECLENAIPFVTTRGSGADELIDPACWRDVMVEPRVDDLAQRLERILDDGARLARPRFDPAENLLSWSAWHAWLASSRGTPHGRSGEPTTSDTMAGPAPSPTILIVTIDAGGVPLSRLLTNVTRHIERFGAAAGHLLMTAMRDPLRHLLAETLDRQASEVGATALVLGPDEVEEAREIVLGADYVIVAGVEHEILPSFFAAALRLLVQGEAAAVSCVVADRPQESGEPVIQEIPAGDIPAMAGLSRPIASGLWAASVTDLRAELSTLEFDHKDYGDLIPAELLGHAAIHRCMLNDKPYQFLPMVGGVRTPPSNPALRGRHWYRIAASTARDLGVERVVHPAAAPWFASLAFGADGNAGAHTVLPETSLLPGNHPLREVHLTGTDAKDAEGLAAALGRPGAALQLRMADGGSGNVGDSIGLSHRSTRLRPQLDLLQVLGDGGRQPFAPSGASLSPARSVAGLRARLIARALSSRSTTVEASTLAAEGGSNALVAWIGPEMHDRPRAYGANLTIEAGEGAFRLARVLPDTVPWQLVFIDVPLLGHLRLAAELRSDNPSTMAVELLLLDQATGAELARCEAIIPAHEVCDIDLNLPAIHGAACVILQPSNSAMAGRAASELALAALSIA